MYKQASHSKSQLMAMHCVQTFCKSEISELGFCHIILTLLLESVKFTDISDILKELKCYACFQLPTASYIDWLTSSDSSLLVSSSSSDFCKINIFFQINIKCIYLSWHMVNKYIFTSTWGSSEVQVEVAIL